MTEPTIILETDRLILRRMLPEDLDALYALYRDPEIRRYFPDGTLTYKETREELEWFLNGHPRHPELGLWTTIFKENNQFIGRCGLLPWDIDGQYEVEVAYLIDKTYWRRGLASEAANAIIRYAFEALKVPRLIALITPGNEASAGVATKIGMTFEREMVDDFGPALIYAIDNLGMK